METMIYLKNVATLSIEAEKCNGCATCTMVCPHRVLKMENHKAVITNLDRCMECGACMKNCLTGAISVHNGVGCAYAVLNGMIKGKEASCGCDSGSCC